MKGVEELLGIKNVDANAVMCYNFVSQDVFTVEETEVALCTAQDKLLVASSGCSVDVRDLDSNGQHLLTFPTVSRVAMMDYCESANFIATLEVAEKTVCVRAYFNWWVSVDNQTLALRKIGSPPEANVCESRLQAVEFDTSACATCVACCRWSGTVAVAFEDEVKLFGPRTREANGRHYVDFEFVVELKVHATPLRVFVCEAHVAYYTSDELHVLKLCFERDSEQVPPAVQVIPGQKAEDRSDNFNNSSAVANDPYFVEWHFSHEKLSSCKSCSFEDDLRDVVHPASFPITLALRSECYRTTIGLTDQPERILLGPRRNSPDCKVVAKVSPDFEPQSEVMALTMLYRKFAAPADEPNFILTFHWVPYYSNSDAMGHMDPLTATVSQKVAEPLPPLHSSKHKSLQSLLCFVSSSKEGYLYDIGTAVSQMCIYKYLGRARSTCVDECFLHTFTSAGLETYALKTPRRMLPSNLHCRECNDTPMRMMGFRPFLNVIALVMSESHLVLLSSSEDSSAESLEMASSTVYSLSKPPLSQLYQDLKELTSPHESQNDKKYVEVLEEAFMILSTGISLEGVAPCSSELKKAHCDVCCLLGDLHLKDEFKVAEAAAYYVHSERRTEAILSRILSLKGELSSQQITKAIIAYLKLEMSRPPLDSSDSPDPALQGVPSLVLDIVAEECPDLLHKLVLRCSTSIFRTDKALDVLRRKLTSKRQSAIYAANTVAVASLLAQTGNEDTALNALKALHKESLVVAMLEMHDLLHKNEQPTALGKLLKKARPDAYLSMLVHSKFNGTMTPEEIVLLLQHSTTEKSLHRIPLLKEFLEAVLSSKRTNAASHPHLLIMLVRIYVGRLQPDDSSPQVTHSSLHSKPASLFGGRSPWVKELPPFNGSSVTKSCSLYATSANLSECCLCWNCWDDLLRLQSLLSSSLPSATVRSSALEILAKTHLIESENYMSLKILCLPPKDAVSLLLEKYPSAVLGYMQEKFGDNTDQWLWLYKVTEKREEEGVDKAYEKIKHGALGYLANELPPERLVNVLPPGKQEYAAYVKRSVERYQAKLLQEKIITLGTELKEMM